MPRLTDDKLARYLPFYALGLTRNPFGRLTDDEWARSAIVPPPIQAAFDAGHHLQLLGRKGRGKSTTLRALIGQCTDAGQAAAYESIPRWRGRFHTEARALAVFALDEAQRLHLWRWPALLWRVQRGDLRLLVGSHRDDRLLYRALGVRVVSFRLGQMNDRAHTAALLARRLRVFALEDAPRVQFSQEACDYLWGRFRDNLRAQDDFLYEYFQQLRAPGTITAAALQAHEPR